MWSLAGTLLMVAMLFAGCSGMDLSDDNGSQSRNTDDLAEYSDIVVKMKSEVANLQRDVESRSTIDHMTPNDYYVVMMGYMDHMGDIRNHMSNSDNMTHSMTNFEQECQDELDRFMDFGDRTDSDYGRFLDNVHDHVNNMNGLLDDMYDYCYDRMNDQDSNHCYDDDDSGHGYMM